MNQDCIGIEARQTIRRHGPFGNIFFRPIEALERGKGSKTSGHTHNFDHVTYLVYGSVRLRKREVDPGTKQAFGEVTEETYKAPSQILIKKNWAHEFEALEDGTRADCIFAIRDWTGEIAEEFDGSMEGYR